MSKGSFVVEPETPQSIQMRDENLLQMCFLICALIHLFRYIYSSQLYEFTLRDCCHVLRTTPVVMTIQLLNLLTSILISNDAFNEPMTQQDYENIMVYAVSWSCGALFEPEDRLKFSSFLQEKVGSPHECEAGLTVFDYFVDPKTRKFQKWVAPEWTPPKGAFSFSSILIPTLDSERSVIYHLILGRPTFSNP